MSRPKKVRDWSRLIAQAERQLGANRVRINEGKRGVPGEKRSSWRLGKGPGSTKETR